LSHETLNLLSESDQDRVFASGIVIPIKCCVCVLYAMFPATENLPTKSVASTTPYEKVLRLGEVVDLSILGEEDKLDLIQARFDFELEQKRMQAATKSDDAPVPRYLWDARLLPEGSTEFRSQVLDPIQEMCLRRWQRHTLRSLFVWLKTRYPILPKVLKAKTFVKGWLQRLLKNEEFSADWESGRDCVFRCTLASWWDWDGGSRPFHWRWPDE
jgi:hypothetical protein